MIVGANDLDVRLNCYAIFNDNMEVVLHVVYEIYNKEYDIKDFEPVSFYYRNISI